MTILKKKTPDLTLQMFLQLCGIPTHARTDVLKLGDVEVSWLHSHLIETTLENNLRTLFADEDLLIEREYTRGTYTGTKLSLRVNGNIISCGYVHWNSLCAERYRRIYLRLNREHLETFLTTAKVPASVLNEPTGGHFCITSFRVTDDGKHSSLGNDVVTPDFALALDLYKERVQLYTDLGPATIKLSAVIMFRNGGSQSTGILTHEV